MYPAAATPFYRVADPKVSAMAREVARARPVVQSGRMPRSPRESAPREPAERESADRPSAGLHVEASAAAAGSASHLRPVSDHAAEAVNDAFDAASNATDDVDAAELEAHASSDASDADVERWSDVVPPDARELHHGHADQALDAELVRRAQGGDHGAFRQLFERYHRRVYAVAFGVLKNRQDALDCVQESFVKVHRHLGSFQGSSSFYTWLYRIAMNLAIDQLRRKKTSRPVEFDDALRRETVEAGDDTIVSRILDENPRKAVIRRELLERVQAALAELPEYHRQVILLREIEGLSYEEMAEALDVPKGTIMSRLFHARRKMQEALRSYVDGELDIEDRP